jgi:hypothetical protein
MRKEANSIKRKKRKKNDILLMILISYTALWFLFPSPSERGKG